MRPPHCTHPVHCTRKCGRTHHRRPAVWRLCCTGTQRTDGGLCVCHTKWKMWLLVCMYVQHTFVCSTPYVDVEHCPHMCYIGPHSCIRRTQRLCSGCVAAGQYVQGHMRRGQRRHGWDQRLCCRWASAASHRSANHICPQVLRWMWLPAQSICMSTWLTASLQQTRSFCSTSTVVDPYTALFCDALVIRSMHATNSTLHAHNM